MIMNTVFDIQDKQQHQKQILIVYKKELKEYAEYLHTLISSIPDIEAVKMQPAPYEQNEMSTSSTNFFLFIGNFPGRKLAMKQLNNGEKSAEYGIFIGQYGRVS